MPPSAASLRVVMISRRSNAEVEMPESPVAVVAATIAAALAVGGNTVPPTRPHLPPGQHHHHSRWAYLEQSQVS